MKINDKEYQAWHEVGHAIACILSGGRVEFIELINLSLNPNGRGSARARCETHNQDMRAMTACGGFAIEYLLYKKKYINISEKDFLQEVFINSFGDKEKFFNGNFKQKNGYYPKEMDIEFMDYSIALSAIMVEYFEVMANIVTELVKKNKLEQNDINRLFSSVPNNLLGIS